MKITEVYNSKIGAIVGSHITLYPYIFYNGVPSHEVRKHEAVHVMQIRREGFFKFYTKYVYYYLQNRFKGMGHYRAYYNIPYEVEAFEKQTLNIDIKKVFGN